MPVLSENSENAVIRIPLYLSGFQRHNRQKAFNIKHFRRIRSIPKLPSKIAKQPLTHKTRNAVSRKASRVRIPNSPPKSPVNKRVCRTFLFCPFAQNRLKTMERTACFLERTRRFRAFLRIRTVKISSFRHRLKFRSTCCRISPIREASFR